MVSVKDNAMADLAFPPPATSAACAVSRAGEELNEHNMLEYL
jgi:hypothetical protein